jgi:hypothetical protein
MNAKSCEFRRLPIFSQLGKTPLNIFYISDFLARKMFSAALDWLFPCWNARPTYEEQASYYPIKNPSEVGWVGNLASLERENYSEIKYYGKNLHEHFNVEKFVIARFKSDKRTLVFLNRDKDQRFEYDFSTPLFMEVKFKDGIVEYSKETTFGLSSDWRDCLEIIYES